ncbi:MAG: FmdB family zinc ribbon protein [Candidatus Hydrogenedentota bacterium]
MPIYTYQIIHDDGAEGDTFEVIRSMSDPPLTHHPQTGERVVRVFSAPNLGGRWSEGATKNNLSDSNLERLGFTKYQRSGKGQYERTAGKKGPGAIDVRD